jgi:type IV pilus assembly protein PilZ
VVRVDYSTVDDFFSEFTQNINEGGMFIETESPAELDSLVHLQFALPGEAEPVKALGRVIRVVTSDDVEPPGMALEFEQMDGETRSRIDAIVQQLKAGAF